MCQSKPKPPPVVVRDPVAEQKQADATAQAEANVALSSRRKRLKGSSLFTTGPQGIVGGSAYSAYSASMAAGTSKSQTLGGT
jgi:hypothetical protein